MSNFHPKPSRQSNSSIQLETLSTLEKKNHFLIVIMGTVIGAIFALFIAYQLNLDSIFFVFLCIFPIGFAYILRKVYINTILKID